MSQPEDSNSRVEQRRVPPALAVVECAGSPVPSVSLRIGIASAVRLVREGLVLSLRNRESIAAVDAFDIDLDGLERLVALAPHVILIDIGHAETATAARRLKIACGSAKLVAFALTEVDEEVFACAAAGYDSYIPRHSSADDLFRAVMDAANGRMQCPPHIAAAMFSRLSNLLQEAPAPCELPSLTARENAILTLAEQGRSNKEIARQLGISAATVKNHIHNILQKLQVGRRAEAVARLRVARPK